MGKLVLLPTAKQVASRKAKEAGRCDNVIAFNTVFYQRPEERSETQVAQEDPLDATCPHIDLDPLVGLGTLTVALSLWFIYLGWNGFAEGTGILGTVATGFITLHQPKE